MSPRIAPLALTGPVVCRGQVLDLPEGLYDWVHVEVDAPVAGEHTVWLYYTGGLDPEVLVVPGGTAGWTRVGVARRDTLVGVRLPDAPELVIRSVSLVAPAHAEAGAAHV
ncbi:hypothetical protein [Goodfellowiella coeruleoviolacea]|uniref:Uncharacterized protein n=1 Tax=Goodfellowiella coeruleoviolacea TaxID=334858 RepID=A0AAE3GGF6_9PSEU|nr:hypothetical protein [Goodfellowiella coeruleoviolacea]MCP2166890.1 hypothetical protein [Goodfellowiella coeruleoviolacea]